MSENSGIGGGTGEEPNNQPRKLKGTRVEHLTEFVQHVEKKGNAFFKKTGKKIPTATIIMAGFSEEQADNFLKQQEHAIKPWQKKKGSTVGT